MLDPVHAIDAYGWSGGIAPLLHNQGTWIAIISFILGRVDRVGLDALQNIYNSCLSFPGRIPATT